MATTRLAFVREPGYVLRWDVYEVHPSGGRSFAGDLLWKDGAWRFESSDDSIRWRLGSNVRGAMRKLRKRYRPIDCSKMCGLLGRTSAAI
jgi:hypothetical protein